MNGPYIVGIWQTQQSTEPRSSVKGRFGEKGSGDTVLPVRRGPAFFWTTTSGLSAFRTHVLTRRSWGHPKTPRVLSRSLRDWRDGREAVVFQYALMPSNGAPGSTRPSKTGALSAVSVAPCTMYLLNMNPRDSACPPMPLQPQMEYKHFSALFCRQEQWEWRIWPRMHNKEKLGWYQLRKSRPEPSGQSTSLRPMLVGKEGKEWW